MPAKAQRYHDIAEHALGRFVDDAERTEWLGERDNATFKVTAGGKHYLLKIFPEADSAAAIESELLWLEALSADTRLAVPQPVRSKDGRLIAEWTNESGGRYVVAMLRWIEGEELGRQPTADETRQLSGMMVQLHKHAMGWRVPGGFQRPEYTVDTLFEQCKKLSLLLETDVMSRDDYAIIQETVRLIAETTQQLEKSHRTWGLIHSDLHESNYVINGGLLSPIDFSCCGFGYYLFDIAETLLHLSPDNRKLFLESYSDQGGNQDLNGRMLDSFFLWQVVRGFAFHSTNPDEQQWLSRSIPSFVRNYARKYIEGESPVFM